MTKDCIVEGISLRRDYLSRGQRIPALCDVSISLKSGQFLSMRGRSGSGKSTLLTLLGLLDAPTSGTVKIKGYAVDFRNMACIGDIRRRHVGFLLQDTGVIERMSVVDNVMLPLVYAGVRQSRKPSMEALDKVGLAHLAQRTVGELSGGERQRTGLARAIVRSPDLIVCDEPTGALDLETTHIVAGVLADEAKRGAGIVVATHDPVLESYAKIRLEMRAGQLVDAGDTGSNARQALSA